MELLLDGQLQTRASAGPTEARERGTIEKRGERGTTAAAAASEQNGNEQIFKRSGDRRGRQCDKGTGPGKLRARRAARHQPGERRMLRHGRSLR
jgi:hypothetical protein